MKDEELLVDKQKKIIDRVVQKIFATDESMYYETTMNLCQAVFEDIQKGRAQGIVEYEAAFNLKPKDIQDLISYKTPCC
jgi:hypothetical protein